MKQTNAEQQARGFIGLAAKYRALLETAGERRVRTFWDIQDRILTSVAADCRDEIEAVRTPCEYEAVLNQLGSACEDALRTDCELMDAFEGRRNQFDLAVALMWEQLPGFLQTRPGQSHTVVYS